MSVRAFKRLLGETSLERKCRLLLGGGILALTSLSFWLYARQTEQLAFDQLTNQGRLLVQPSLAELHLQSKERDVMAVFRCDFNTEGIRGDIHMNRAWLITYALVTALLITAGAYFIIRQVIVKPVKHLKEVTNAVADGKLTVRSDLHTNDEFEDL